MLKWISFFLKGLFLSALFLGSSWAVAKGKEPGGLLVLSNAKNTSVLANGLLVGKAASNNNNNEIIYLPAGRKHSLTITAPGFLPQHLTLELKPNQVRELRVELKKMANSVGEEVSDYGSVRGIQKPKKTIIDFTGGEGEDPPPPQVAGPQYNAPFSGQEPSVMEKALNLSLKISPFGVPQFAKGERGFGILAASLQAVGLGGALYYYWTAGRFQTTAQAELGRIPTREAWDKYKKDSDTYLDSLYIKQLSFLGIFAVSWGLSVFDAYRTSPTPNKATIGFWGVPKGPHYAWGSHFQYDF